MLVIRAQRTDNRVRPDFRPRVSYVWEDLHPKNEIEVKIAHLDFETRSRVDLADCGAFRYACDLSTEILMAGVSRDDPDAPVFLWVNPKYETPDMMSEDEALEILRDSDLVYAHNAPFEQAMTWGKGLPGVRIKTEQWRCTAALARKAALPSSLESCGAALNLEVQKDKEGKRLIKLFSEPQKDGEFVDPKSRPADWLAFGNYCRTDVKVEKLIHARLKAFELTGAVLESFLFDLRMNLRGIPINVPAATNAQKIIDHVQGGVTEEFQKLTGLNPTQRERVRELVGLPNMQAETVQEALKVESKNHRILQLYSLLSYAAVKKVRVMLDQVCPDGRVRGGHLWYGTGPGRHSGKGLQPQNFKKTPAWMRPITGKVYQAICDGKDADHLEMIYGDPMEIISGCIRHFIHDPSKQILDGDYSAIQARIICWLAGQKDVLEGWRKGNDLYKWMAGHIYGVATDSVTPDQREVGKRVILGGGFQMGAPKFQSTCLEQYGLDLPIELCERGIEMFRKLHDKIRDYWYFLDRSARSAITDRGTKFGPFIVKTLAGIEYLLMTLPSGRSIAYPHPKIEMGEDEYGRDQVTYWGQLFGSTQWGRVKLYGGKFAENMTMGCEADIMNHGLIEAEKRGMPPFMLVHDQALAFQENGHTAEEFAAALADLPAWAAGLPVKVEARQTPYYLK